ncbi:mandelate racemase/muconate lactonizing enzyme family protein [Phaeacidiphilus oryzae]|uniref:mandelate racemase/muconate lactonizing enzyme family protein n=1 Tax=Phaeacidiphilus oryzae TaxID=348818 RepID=UPI000564EDAF|nr:enolase C-terminal domain-like protein [Phaeacidiphilus oryzae]
MRLDDLTVWTVNVPYARPFTSSFETRTGTTRTILRLRTDDGLEGWGETMHGSPTAAIIEKIYPQIRGTDPHRLQQAAETFHMVPYFYGYLGAAALAGIEMACWDLIGKAAGRPLADLLGGPVRDRVPVTAVLTPGLVGEPTGAVALADALSEEILRVQANEGAGAFKIKGSTDPLHDVVLLERIRERLGRELPLRVDPNAHWTVPRTLELARRIEDLGLEYLEDPVPGIAGMAAVRRDLRVPLCTNMCVTEFDHVAPAIRLGAVDVVHGDVHRWAGISPTRRLAGVLETHGLGMNLHSGGEIGLSTAAHLHLTSATPQIGYAIDTVYQYLEHDVVTRPFEIRDGAMTPPAGPGLGVEVDPEALASAARAHERDGDLLL